MSGQEHFNWYISIYLIFVITDLWVDKIMNIEVKYMQQYHQFY